MPDVMQSPPVSHETGGSSFASPPPSHGTLALLLAYGAMMALAIAINLLPVVLTTLSRDFHGLSAEQLGRIGAVTFAGLVSAILCTGPLVDRLPQRGPKLFAIGGNLLITLGLALLAFCRSYPALLFSVFVMGYGAGTLDMVLSPIVAALRPNHRTVAMNLLHSFYCIGAVVTILLGALALRYGLGWRHLSLLLIALPALVALGFGLVPIPRLIAEGHTRTPLGALARQPFFLLALLTIFLGGATEISMAYWLPTYAERDLHFVKFSADMGFLGFSLAMAVGRIAIGLLGHRVSALALMKWCCITSTALFLLAALSRFPSLALTACILAGLTGSALWPSTLAITADRYPHGGATMFGILATLGNLAGMFMPWLVGLIADHASLALGLGITAACPFLMLGCLAFLGRLTPSLQAAVDPDAPAPA